MKTEITAYPLAWPMGWRRTGSLNRAQGKFNTKVAKQSTDGHYNWSQAKSLTIFEAGQRLLSTLVKMKIDIDDDVVISSNLMVRLDGMPRSGQANPVDPGVCVYWITRSGERRCMAIDRYDKVADNIAAIAATLEAMRAIERHGGAEILDRAFTAFVALPAPTQWFDVLGFDADEPVTPDKIERRFKELAMKFHPDREGGSTDAMAELNRARATGLQQTTRLQ